jgi:hypothetical protein
LKIKSFPLNIEPDVFIGPNSTTAFFVRQKTTKTGLFTHFLFFPMTYNKEVFLMDHGKRQN